MLAIKHRQIPANLHFTTPNPNIDFKGLKLEKMVADPDVDYTTTPMNVMKFVEFMNLAGTVKKKLGSWKELFFPIAYEKPGS